MRNLLYVLWIFLVVFVAGCRRHPSATSQLTVDQQEEAHGSGTVMAPDDGSAVSLLPPLGLRDHQHFLRSIKRRTSDVTMPPPQEMSFSQDLRDQMADRKFVSLNKYVGKYEYGDAKGRLFGQQEEMGIEIRPDGTYSRSPGKGGWDSTYSIVKNKLVLHGYSWKRRNAKATLNGAILTIKDKSEYRGSVILVKTWPIKGVHY